MRKNTARHWLHATLDLLPVILIPLFMIYSHRHDLSTDITIQQDVYKDFYQYVKNGKPNNLNDIRIDDGTMSIIDNYLVIDNEANYTYLYFDIGNDTINENDILYLTFNAYNSDSNLQLGVFWDDYDDFYEEITITITPNVYSLYKQNTQVDNYLYPINFQYEATDLFYIKDVQLFNLTQIFGSGNEPTKEVFESYLTQDYYDFGSNQVKVGTTDVQAKNNDIMSVFMDSFNTSINKYFNMGNVFNMTSVYNWFNANIFGGTAPVVIYSVWNIVLYEFVMDLLFLLYGLFMWFVDMCKRLIEKPLDSIK